MSFGLKPMMSSLIGRIGVVEGSGLTEGAALTNKSLWKKKKPNTLGL